MINPSNELNKTRDSSIILWIPALFKLLMFAIIATGCSPSPVRKNEIDERKKIITTFTILADMAREVAGDKLVIESITKPGAEIHDYEPTPLDIVKAQSAALVVRNGMGLERWFEKFMGNLNSVPGVNLSEGVVPISIGSGPYDGKPNPHSWMSPSNAITYVENLRKAFINIDPINEALYTSNATRYSNEIREVDRQLRAKLKKLPADKRWLVTSEGAFSYLARDYDMKELFLWPVNADQEGTPQQVKHVVDTVVANKIPVIFSESTISDKSMKQVAKEAGTRFGGVLYVDSLTDADGVAPTYLKLLDYNAKVITTAFDQKQ